MSQSGNAIEMAEVPLQTSNRAFSVYPKAITYPQDNNSLEAQVTLKCHVQTEYS